MNPKDQKDQNQKDQKNPNNPSRTDSAQKAGEGNWNDKTGGDAQRKSPGGQPDQSTRKTTEKDGNMRHDGGMNKDSDRNSKRGDSGQDSGRSQRDPND